MAIGSKSVRAIKKEWLTKFGFASALLLLTIISYITFYSVDQFADSSRLAAHTRLVVKQINQVYSNVKDAESAERGYVITGDESFLKTQDEVVAELPHEFARLRDLVYDNPGQQKSVDVLEDLITKKMRLLRLAIDAMATGKGKRDDEIIALVSGAGREVMEKIRIQANRMVAVEDKLLLERAQLVETKAMITKRWILFGNMLAIVLLIAAFWLILWEIEHRKASQRKVERSSAQLELINKELESFSYSVSHDLRSPLRAIDGYSRMFEEDFADRLDDEGRRLLSVIRGSSKKMGQLIDDLLAFSRMGRKPVDAAIVDMNVLVDEVWSEVCVNARKTSLHLKKELLPVGWGDRVLLRQALMNLFSNAVKYSGKKAEPVIEITGKQSEHEVVYSVRDNGVGFDMRFYNKLFGVFQRLHPEHEFPGTGVGLAIAQRVIVRHGGRIWAESKLDEYTIFNFSLPIGDAA